MNRTIRSPALILKTWPIGDNHRGARLLLSETGLVDACAYGASSRKNPLKGTLQIITAGTVSLWHDRPRNRYRIESFDPVSYFEQIRTDIERIETFAFWSEVLMKSMAGAEIEESLQIFSLINQSLALLNSEKSLSRVSIDRITLAFLWHYLILSGFHGDFTHCGKCSRKSDSEDLLFWRNDGEIFCNQCGDPGDYPLSPGGRKWLERAESLPLEQAFSIGLEDRTATGIISHFQSMIEHLAGTAFKTRMKGSPNP